MIRHTKRVLKITTGFLLLAAGALMLVLPGPGIVAIGLGLAILSREFAWAHDLLQNMKERATGLRDRVLKYRE